MKFTTDAYTHDRQRKLAETIHRFIEYPPGTEYVDDYTVFFFMIFLPPERGVALINIFFLKV